MKREQERGTKQKKSKSTLEILRENMPKSKKARDQLRGYVPGLSPLPPHLMSPKTKGDKNRTEGVNPLPPHLMSPKTKGDRNPIEGKGKAGKNLQAKKPKRYVKAKDLAGNRSQVAERHEKSVKSSKEKEVGGFGNNGVQNCAKRLEEIAASGTVACLDIQEDRAVLKALGEMKMTGNEKLVRVIQNGDEVQLEGLEQDMEDVKLEPRRIPQEKIIEEIEDSVKGIMECHMGIMEYEAQIQAMTDLAVAIPDGCDDEDIIMNETVPQTLMWEVDPYQPMGRLVPEEDEGTLELASPEELERLLRAEGEDMKNPEKVLEKLASPKGGEHSRPVENPTSAKGKGGPCVRSDGPAGSVSGTTHFGSGNTDEEVVSRRRGMDNWLLGINWPGLKRRKIGPTGGNRRWGRPAKKIPPRTEIEIRPGISLGDITVKDLLWIKSTVADEVKFCLMMEDELWRAALGGEPYLNELYHRIKMQKQVKEGKGKIQKWREVMMVKLAPEIAAEYDLLHKEKLAEAVPVGEDVLEDEDLPGLEQLASLFSVTESKGFVDIPDDLQWLVSRLLSAEDQARLWLANKDLMRKAGGVLGSNWLRNLKKEHGRREREKKEERLRQIELWMAEEEERIRREEEERQGREERELEERIRRAAQAFRQRNELNREPGVSYHSISRHFQISKPELKEAVGILHEELKELLESSDDDLLP